MNAEAKRNFLAWHPFSPKGVARMVGFPPWQCWLAVAAAAFVCAGMVRHAVVTAWVPVLEAASAALPTRGQLHHGALDLPGERTARVLASNPFLSVSLYAEPGDMEAPSEVRLVFAEYGIRMCSLFGCAAAAYPIDIDFPFNRVETTAWWGAWRPFVLGMVYCVSVLFFLILWCLFASVAFLPAVGLAWYLDRELKARAAIRLAVLCQVPGALLLGLGLVLHVRGNLDLVGVTVLAGAQLLLSAVFLVCSLWHLPRLQTQPLNPFQTEKNQERKPAPKANPFAE